MPSSAPTSSSGTAAKREVGQACFNKLDLSMKLYCATNVRHKRRDAINGFILATTQSARHNVCVALVWFPLHQGGGPKRKHNMTGSGFQPGKRNTVNCVLVFRPESCHRWCCVFHLTCGLGLLPRKWSLSATVHLSGWKAALLLLSWILAYD